MSPLLFRLEIVIAGSLLIGSENKFSGLFDGTFLVLGYSFCPDLQIRMNKHGYQLFIITQDIIRAAPDDHAVPGSAEIADRIKLCLIDLLVQ